MTQTLLKKLFILTLSLVIFGLFVPRPSADEDSSDVLDMVVGDIQSVAVSSLNRVSVTDPAVADISDANGDKVSLIAKKAGSTVLFIWDSAGKRSLRVRVANQDLTVLKGRIQKLLDEDGIEDVTLDINMDIGKVVLTGELSKEDKNRLSDLLDPYSDDLLNLVREKKNQDLIQVDMQIVEINTSLEKDLGVLWGNSSSNNAGLTGGNTANTGSSNGTPVLSYVENQPTGDKFADLFKIGNFQRNYPLAVAVNTWIEEGKARLISKPRLVVESGKQASFLVGGEIPIESTTSSNTGNTLTQNTTYTQYGVNLSVTPTVQDSKIDVLLNVDIRDVNTSTPITVASGSSGNNVSFITRTASTDLLMDNKQTIVLAGLIKYEDSVNLNEVPFLSKIPVVGGLFRNRSEPADSNTEMVIILTPTVLTEKKYQDKQIVMPTPEEKSSWKEIDSKYEQEPINSVWPPAKVAPADADANSNAQINPMDAVTAYARTVQEKISKSIAYPQLSGSDAPAGTVKLKLHILKDGSLDSAEVMESSGSTVLDEDAMQAAKTAAPYDAFTNGMLQPDLIFTIPIVYNKAISSAQASAEKTIASS